MIELGQIKIDPTILERQLRHDLKDDWFPDTVKFKDYFGKSKIAKIATENFENNHGEYVPMRRVVANIPKSDFTLRAALETGIVDRAIYHGVCAHLCKFFDPLIPWFVFSHRSATGSQTSKYMFRRGVLAWIDFLGAIRASLSPGKYLLTTDLTTYFDNINIYKLKSEMSLTVTELKESASTKNSLRAHIEFLFKCLKQWTYEDYRGLPQNRDASSFLANIYMRRIDLKMANSGYKYFRYMDDIKIVCDSEMEARKALKELVIELRQIGLSVNSKKTSIDYIENADSIRECIEESSPEVRYLQALWDSRNLSSIKASFAPLKKLALDCLSKDDLSSREFRFAINRLILLAGCHEISVPETYFSDITTLIISALHKQPTPTDKYVSYLERVPLNDLHTSKLIEFMVDEERNIYEWQSFRLWSLLGTRKVQNKELMSLAISTLAREDGPARSGATLYIGAFGEQNQKEEIAKKFSSLATFMGQRAALIAIQDVPFKPVVRDNVVGKVRHDLSDVYRNAKQIDLGYFSAPEPVSLTQIVSMEPHSA